MIGLYRRNDLPSQSFRNNKEKCRRLRKTLRTIEKNWAPSEYFLVAAHRSTFGQNLKHWQTSEHFRSTLGSYKNLENLQNFIGSIGYLRSTVGTCEVLSKKTSEHFRSTFSARLIGALLVRIQSRDKLRSIFGALWGHTKTWRTSRTL